MESKIKVCPKCQAWSVGEVNLCSACGTALDQTDYQDLYWKLDKDARKRLLHDVAVKLGLSEDQVTPTA